MKLIMNILIFFILLLWSSWIFPDSHKMYQIFVWFPGHTWIARPGGRTCGDWSTLSTIVPYRLFWRYQQASAAVVEGWGPRHIRHIWRDQQVTLVRGWGPRLNWIRITGRRIWRDQQATLVRGWGPRLNWIRITGRRICPDDPIPSIFPSFRIGAPSRGRIFRNASIASTIQPFARIRHRQATKVGGRGSRLAGIRLLKQSIWRNKFAFFPPTIVIWGFSAHFASAGIVDGLIPGGRRASTRTESDHRKPSWQLHQRNRASHDLLTSKWQLPSSTAVSLCTRPISRTSSGHHVCRASIRSQSGGNAGFQLKAAWTEEDRQRWRAGELCPEENPNRQPGKFSVTVIGISFLIIFNFKYELFNFLFFKGDGPSGPLNQNRSPQRARNMIENRQIRNEILMDMLRAMDANGTLLRISWKIHRILN